MTTAVVTDLAERSVATLEPGYDTSHPNETIIRTFSVTGVDDATFAARIHTAITATGIPDIGDAHPSVATIFAAEIRAQMVGPTQATVEVTYRPLDVRDQLRLGKVTKIVSWRSATTSRETGLDINGDVMDVSYAGTAWKRVGADVEASGSHTMVGTVRAQVIDAVAVATLTVWTTSFAASDITDYVGKVNDDTWSTYPAKTFLCSGATYEPDIGGGFLTYELQYDPDTWQFPATIIQTYWGFNVEPPETAVGNGITLYDVYESADFDGIGSL